MNFVKKYQGKLKNNIVAKFIFKIYQVGLAVALYLIIKFRKNIIANWKQCLVYVAITVPMCIAWTLFLHQHDAVPPWFFWEHTLICGGLPIEIFGIKIVFEDILFYTFGQILGFIFYASFLKEYKANKLSSIINNWKFKLGFMILFLLVFSYFGIFIDYISTINLWLFAGPGFILWLIAFKKINLYLTLKYMLVMGGIVYLYDFSQVVLLPELMSFLEISNPEAYGLWIYNNGGIYSEVYSKSRYMWLWKREPVAMVLLFPMAGMLFQVGLMCCLKKIMKKK